MPEPAATYLVPPQSALLLVGHGSRRNAQSREPTCRLAATLRATGAFAEVHAAFCKEDPDCAAALAAIRAPEVYIVPNFAGEGYYTRDFIPRALALSGPLTHRNGQALHYTPPVGSHRRMPALLEARALALAAAAQIDARAATLLIIAHGSSRGGGSAGTPEAVAAALRHTARFAHIATVYLEQAPFARDWRQLATTPDVIAAPFLIAEGLHGSQDVPALFGLGIGQRGPARLDGQQVWITPGIGDDADIVAIILDRVAAAALGDR